MIPTLSYLVNSRKAARRGRGQIRWQGLLTVSLTATVFCIATLPKGLVLLYDVFATNPNKIAVRYRIATFVSLHRITGFLSALNIPCNFYIYCLTVLSFRNFMKTKVLNTCISLFSWRRRNFVVSENEDIAMRDLNVQAPQPGNAPASGVRAE